MRHFLSVSARAGHVCCVATMAVLFGFVQFSSGHTQARAPERSAGPTKGLISEHIGVPRWLADTVVRAAQATNTDPAVLLALADKDEPSSEQAQAQTSSAQGLFQFGEGTWLEVLRRYGPKHGYRAEAKAIHVARGRPVVANSAERERILRLRRDPYLSALMTGEMITTHRQIRAGKVARDPAFAELYMAYALSVNGASRFMELLRDRPSPSEAVSARRHGPRISSRAADE